MGAMETADLLEAAQEHLEDARDDTGLDIQDVAGYGRLLAVKFDLESVLKAAAESWEQEWDGDNGLYGGERALSDAATCLDQAASGEDDAAGIKEAKSFEEAATESAKQARTQMDAFNEAQTKLVELLEKAAEQTDHLIVLAKAVVGHMADCSEHAETGADKAEEIAEALRNAVA